MGDWLHTEMTVTHPSSNRARCRATSLMETNMLTTTPHCHNGWLVMMVVGSHSGSDGVNNNIDSDDNF